MGTKGVNLLQNSSRGHFVYFDLRILLVLECLRVLVP